MNGSCDCTFAWWSVIPPTHCPKCGRCLGCGAAPYPQPWPINPWPHPWPSYPWNPQTPYTQNPTTITYTTTANGVYS